MVKSADPLLLMGVLLVKAGVLSPERLDAVILRQIGHRALRWPGKRLGDHLVMENLVTRGDLEALLEARDRTAPWIDETVLGEIAVRNGLLTPERLAACLREQESARDAGETPPLLGKLILRKRLIGEQELQALLDRQRALVLVAEEAQPSDDGAALAEDAQAGGKPAEAA